MWHFGATPQGLWQGYMHQPMGQVWVQGAVAPRGTLVETRPRDKHAVALLLRPSSAHATECHLHRVCVERRTDN